MYIELSLREPLSPCCAAGITRFFGGAWGEGFALSPISLFVFVLVGVHNGGSVTPLFLPLIAVVSHVMHVSDFANCFSERVLRKSRENRSDIWMNGFNYSENK